MRYFNVRTGMTDAVVHQGTTRIITDMGEVVARSDLVEFRSLPGLVRLSDEAVERTDRDQRLLAVTR